MKASHRLLRQFSPTRIIVLFLADWLGSLGALGLAALLRAELGALPAAWQASLRALGLAAGRVGEGAAPQQLLSPSALLLAAGLWPLFLVTFAVYDGRRNANLRAELANVAKAAGAATVCYAGGLYLTGHELPRGLFVLFLALDLPVLGGGRR
ncbi:MAG: hypothetical protein ACUVX9_18895, partial [Anaerolineae bacterium]